MEFRRTLACTVVALACIFAGFLSGKAKYCAYTDQQPSNPERSLTLAFVNNACSDGNAQRSQNKPPHWYTSPEWWLVIVAVPSIILIWYQARETARSAKAAEASVKTIISKERARLWVEPSEEMADMQRGLMLFKVCFSGSTEATIKESGA